MNYKHNVVVVCLSLVWKENIWILKIFSKHSFSRIRAIRLRLLGPLAPPKSGTFKSVRLSVMRGGGLMMAAYSGSLGPQGQSTATTIKVGESKYLTKIPYKVLI